jgi:hypothetical protein
LENKRGNYSREESIQETILFKAIK